MGNKQGKARYYHENGKLWFDGHFKDDKFNDKGITTWHPNGNKKFTGDFVKGLKQGKGILRYETGDVWFDGTFKDDKFDGKDCKIYY